MNELDYVKSMFDKYIYEINYNPKMWVPVKLKNVD